MSSRLRVHPLEEALEEGGPLGLTVSGCVVALADEGGLELDTCLEVAAGLTSWLHPALGLHGPGAKPVAEHPGLGLPP